MNSAMGLLYAIGEIQEDYILDAHSGLPKRFSSRRKLGLIAAIAAVLLLLAGCAAAAWHWYTAYFTQERQQPLSNGQIGYINDNTQEFRLSQTCDGYTLELKSVISESNTAYVTFGLTAPEDVDLSSVLDVQTEERLSFPGLLAIPAGSGMPADLSYSVHDDGDGKNNTLYVVLKIDSVSAEGEGTAFGPGKMCQISFREIVKWGYDRQYEQELRSTKYAGQTEIMFTPDESLRLHPKTALAAGEWKFEMELTGADSQTVELLTAPASIAVLVVRTGEQEYDVTESTETVRVTSIRLSPLSLTVAFEKPEPADNFDCVYLNPAMFSTGPESSQYEDIFLMLKDGTKIEFRQGEGAKDAACLFADSPIVLQEAEYLQLADGTKISVPAR